MKRDLILSLAGLALSSVAVAAQRSPAVDIADCPPTAPPVVQVPALPAGTLLGIPTQEFSVTDEQFHQAPCRRSTPFTDPEIATWLDAYANPAKGTQSREIHGIQFQDENPRLLLLFEKLTTLKDHLDRPVPTEQRRWKSACTKVACAAREIFGEKEAPRLLFLLGRFGFNGSHYARNESSPWAPRDLDEILMALSDFPESVLPFENGYSLVHFTRGERRPGGDENTTGNALIEFYDGWDKYSQAGRMYAIAHEVSHRIDSRLQHLSESARWRKISDWTQEDDFTPDGKFMKYFFVGKPEAASSVYGLFNPSEDFAESVTAYRYNGAELKVRSPEKYDLLKELVFDGLEYTSPEGCAPDKAFSVQLRKEAAAALQGRTRVTPTETDRALRSCASWVAEAVFNTTKRRGALPRLEECAGASLSRETLERAFSRRKKDMRYPDLAASGLGLRNANAAPPALAARAAQGAMARLVDLIVDGTLSGQAKNAKEIGKDRTKPPEKFCDTLSAYGTLETNYLFGNLAELQDELLLATPAYLAPLQNVIKKVCIDLQRGSQKTRKNVSRQELSKALRVQLGF